MLLIVTIVATTTVDVLKEKVPGTQQQLQAVYLNV